jgi:hypothetical protein
MHTNILIEKPEVKRSVGISRHISEDITRMNLKETGYKNVDGLIWLRIGAKGWVL